MIVFEQEPAIGGVWAPTRTYPGLRANNSPYAYSDHPFPTAGQVRHYLASYVALFELGPLIRLSTEVVRVARRADGFEVTVRGPDGLGSVACDFVVVCAGTYSEPQIPEIAGAQDFTGTVVHSSRATDPALFAGKRVVVVEAGKSALDCAAGAAEVTQHCTLVFRAPHWMAPRYVPGRIPIDRVLLGWLPELFLRYDHVGGVERFLHGPGRIFTWLFWRLTGLLFRAMLCTPAVMVPDQLLPLGLENLGFAPEFYHLARRGRVQLRRGTIAAFGDGADVILATGDRVVADVVIFANGWRQTLPFLAPEIASTTLRDGRFWLYRHILPPTEQRLGFIGYASSTGCQLTSEISAHWLSQAFRGELRLPPVDDMHSEIQRVNDWLADVFPARPKGYFVGPHLAHHIGDLLGDIGLPTRRTSNIVAEYLGPFTPARYSDVAEQRRLARTARSATEP